MWNWYLDESWTPDLSLTGDKLMDTPEMVATVHERLRSHNPKVLTAK